MPKNKTFLTLVICLCVFLGFLLINQALAQDSGSSSTSPDQGWMVEEILNGPRKRFKPDGNYLPLNNIGTEFLLPDTHPYFPGLKICSSEVVRIILEATAGLVSFHIEPVSVTAKSKTTITITGLSPFGNNEIYHHQDGFIIKKFTSVNGEYSFIQDLSKPHHIYLKITPSTIYVGGPNDNVEAKGVGVWHDSYWCQLTTNVYEEIVIDADNIVLSGGNHIISGTGSGYGIYLNGHTGVHIEGCTVQNFYNGIYLSYSCTNTLYSNITNLNTHTGIYLYASSHNHLIYNTANSNNWQGIMIHYYSDHNCVIENTANLNMNGIVLRGWWSEYNTVTFNTANENRQYGISIWDAKYNTISNNTANSNGFSGFDLSSWSTNNNYITQNTMANNKYGIYIYKTLPVFIWHNNIYDNTIHNVSSTTSQYVHGIWFEVPMPVELSYNGKGNWWGHTSPPLFTPGVDSNDANVVDSYPYGVKYGWNIGVLPGEIVFDDSPPTGSFTIQNISGGEEDTDSTEVVLLIYAQDSTTGVAQMRFSNDAVNWSLWENYQDGVKPWDLIPGDGPKTVYAEVKNGIELTSVFSDTIILITTIDATPPDTSIIEVTPDPTDVNPTVRATATDGISIITAAEFFLDDNDPGEDNATAMTAEDDLFNEMTEVVSRVIDISGLTIGPHTVHVRSKDAAGNWDPTPASQYFTIIAVVPTNTPPVITETDLALALSQSPITEDIIWTFDLTNFESDVEDGPAADGNNLIWSISDVDLFTTAEVDPTTDILTMTPQPNAFGSDEVTFILTDSGGLIDTYTTILYINPVNDPPTIDLTVPDGGQTWGLLHPPFPPKIKWNVNDVDGDTLTISLYYSVSDSPWFTITTFNITPAYTDFYEWDTTGRLDDPRYRIMVECGDGVFTPTHQSADYFTIDNFLLRIVALDPRPFGQFNPEYEEILLPFELSEPANNVTVSIMDWDLGYIIGTIFGPTFMEAGIYFVSWDGRINGDDQPAHDYSFKVQGNGTYAWSPGFIINNTMPAFIDLSATPEKFWPSVTPTTISYTILSLDTVFTTLEIRNEMGGLVATLFSNDPQEPGLQSTVWDGTGITEAGIFKYEFPRDTCYRIENLSQYRANPKSGVITAIDLSDTVITSSPDTNLTVYSRPITSTINIVQNPTLASDITYALGEISKFPPEVISPTHTYVVSSFYDITTPEPVDFPVIVALNYAEDLSPEEITLFRYDPKTEGFIAVGCIADPVNHILYAELHTLSLLVLMTNRDVIKPTIQDLVLTHQVLNFTIKDDLAGINIPSIKVILDGEDITDKLTITGEMGDLIVTVSGQEVFPPWLETHTMLIIAQDRGGNEVRETISFTTGYAQVKLVLKPEALKVNPGVLTAYLKFPEPFGIPTTIEATLDGAVQERWMIDYEGKPELELEAPIVVMKFRRADIEKALLDTEFVLKGKFDDGTALFGQLYDFEGKDSIMKVVESGKK